MGRQLDVNVDRSVCIGAGMCAGSAPELFELDATHRSRPRTGRVADEPPLWEAAENCPVEAISLHDAGNGEELFPGE